jgi:hypothetical protein
MRMDNGTLKEFPTFNSQRRVSLTRSELGRLLDTLQVRQCNRLSPLPALRRTRGSHNGRTAQAVLSTIPGLEAANAEDNLYPLIAPDRIIEATMAVFGQAPKKMHFYASRSALHMVGVVQDAGDELMLILPLFPVEVGGWVEGNLQFSGPLSLAAPFESFDAGQLAFLLALIDAYKSELFGSYHQHQGQPSPLSVTPQQILETDACGQDSLDRRWLVVALNEVLRSLIHVGGLTQVGLPRLTAGFVSQEIRRYQQAGHLTTTIGGQAFELSKPMVALAADLSQWINLICLHDVQVNSAEAGKIAAVEEIAVFIATQTTVWSLASLGLAGGGGELSGVSFGLRSASTGAQRDLIRVFLEPEPNAAIDPEFYNPVVALTPIPAPQTAPPQAPQAISQAQGTTPGMTAPRFCRFCGKPIDANSRFCRHCGKSLALTEIVGQGGPPS